MTDIDLLSMSFAPLNLKCLLKDQVSKIYFKSIFKWAGISLSNAVLIYYWRKSADKHRYIQCDFRFDLFLSFSFANYFLVLVSFKFYQTC